jgi:hypothetical protein
MVSNELIIYAFDPGDTTGWAMMRYNDGYLWESGSVPFDDMCKFLTNRFTHKDITVAVVCEDFALFGGKAKAQTGSKFKAVQIIGMLRLWIYDWDIEFVLQPPNIKPIAERLTGIQPVGTHDKSHHIDAYNHGSYYLRSIGHYQTKLEREGLGE